MTKSIQPKIVLIGGGTGSFTLLRGIKHYTPNITALVNMSDDGGSTGVLRDELGVLPPGDVRQCLVALSETRRVRDLFGYRFGDGSLKGHSFGNLFLSAVEQMSESFEEAVSVASEVLRITGQVIPVTLDKAVLHVKTKKGTEIVGQHDIDNAKLDALRPEVFFEGEVKLNYSAKKAIKAADIVVIAPGSMYGSLGSALIVDGMKEALQKTKAKIVCVTNLVNKPGQTDGFTVSDHVAEVERMIGAPGIIDYVIYNTDEPTPKIYEKYVRDDELTLEFDLDQLQAGRYIPVGLPLIDKGPLKQDKNDAIRSTRSLIRHDSDRTAREIMKISFS